MIRMKNVLAMAGMLALMAGPAMAQSPTVYFGVHGGKTMANTELTNTPGTFSLDGLGSGGYVGGVHVGADLQLPSSMVFFGIFGGYDWQNTEFKVTAGSSSFTADLGNSWYAGGRAGIVTHGAKVYVLTAYRQTDWSSSVKTLSIDNPKGFDLGIGIDVPVAKNISLGVEGVRTQYQKDEFLFGTTPKPTGIHGETDAMSVMARLNFQFGGPQSIFDDRADVKPSHGCDPKLAGCK